MRYCWFGLQNVCAGWMPHWLVPKMKRAKLEDISHYLLAMKVRVIIFYTAHRWQELVVSLQPRNESQSLECHRPTSTRKRKLKLNFLLENLCWLFSKTAEASLARNAWWKVWKLTPTINVKVVKLSKQPMSHVHWGKKLMPLQRYNAWPHISITTSVPIKSMQIWNCSQPPLQLDLVLSDFWLRAALKKHHKGVCNVMK